VTNKHVIHIKQEIYSNWHSELTHPRKLYNWTWSRASFSLQVGPTDIQTHRQNHSTMPSKPVPTHCQKLGVG